MSKLQIKTFGYANLQSILIYFSPALDDQLYYEAGNYNLSFWPRKHWLDNFVEKDIVKFGGVT